MSRAKSVRSYVERMLCNDESALYEIYDDYSERFLAFIANYGLSKVEAEDIFQETIIALYQNVMKGNINIQEASMKTYIWSIGKYKAIDILRKKKKRVDWVIANDKVEPIEIKENIITVNQRLLYKHFSALGNSCQEILKSFYYDGLSIEEIVQFSNYKDANTVKSTKSRCIKKLRKLINRE